ncbi:MAG: MotA/TolQ/ExbB proton channel family protein [Candidatus Cyclonatronum sp.]|uniref:motility protein A n=1 Tax=Cyclonatronum sp. TaxID=3024185 RepID=UPI0025B8DEE8|nr:MotA/TolQ/ExbB proton channel family protein [Cyclonatronum sp.]MCC5935382.1 MotA/TolQ/ExbB proton channel family protein [Balneolales bacterium]MCH8487737.1 MotA/TolQ/ExbB proton channel family protein [Cyclonatronum sp.]
MRISWATLISVLLFGILLTLSALQTLDVVQIIRFPAVFDFLNLPSVGIVVGGVMLHVLISYPYREIRRALFSFLYLFSESGLDRETFKNDRRRILEWHRMYRDNRNKTRKELSEQLTNTFEGYVFTLLNTNYTREEITDMAEIKIEERYNDKVQTSRVFQTMGTAAPAFGMLGTLLGLIIMLANFQDAEQLGLGLSFALMTTLYGLAFAHLLLFPLATKFKVMAQHQYFRERVMLEGILMLHEGKAPLMIHDKLGAFISTLNDDMKDLNVPR